MFEDEGELRRRRVKAQRRREQRRAAAAELTGEAGISAAKEAALSILDRSDQSVDACRRKLMQRGYRKEVVEPALQRLEEVGVLDDERYARSLVRGRHQSRALVGRALREELRRKGLSPSVIESAMEAELPEADDTEVLDQLVERKLVSSRKLDREAQTRRIVSMLLRRGYSSGQAFAALERVRSYQEDA